MGKKVFRRRKQRNAFIFESQNKQLRKQHLLAIVNSISKTTGNCPTWNGFLDHHFNLILERNIKWTDDREGLVSKSKTSRILYYLLKKFQYITTLSENVAFLYTCTEIFWGYFREIPAVFLIGYVLMSNMPMLWEWIIQLVYLGQPFKQVRSYWRRGVK